MYLNRFQNGRDDMVDYSFFLGQDRKLKLVFLDEKRPNDKVLAVRIQGLAPFARVPDQLLMAVVDPVTHLVKTVHNSEIVVVSKTNNV